MNYVSLTLQTSKTEMHEILLHSLQTFTLIPKPRKQDMGKATRLWLHQRQKIIINDLNWVTKANKFEMTRAVVTTFWGYFLINPNTSASNGYFTLKIFLILCK